jgi:YidC/Oxa1 family membrane protein insertase
MDNRRIFLLAALGLVGYLIFNAWMQDYGPKTHRQTRSKPAVSQQQASVPPAPATSTAAQAGKKTSKPTTPAINGAAKLPRGHKVVVTTDVMRVTLSTAGASVRRVALLKYSRSEKQGSPPVELLHPDPSRRLILESGYKGKRLPGAGANFTVSTGTWHLRAGQKKIRVPFTWRNNGVTVTRVYTFTRGSYQIGVASKIDNASTQALSGAAFARFRRHSVPVSHSIFSLSSRTYSGPALYDGEDYSKLSYDDLDEKPVSKVAAGGWAAMVNQYFLAAVIPSPKLKVHYYARHVGGKRYVIGGVLPKFNIAPGSRLTRHSKLFIGPKLQDRLGAVAPGLPRTVDYGKFTVIAQPIFKVLEAIHWALGNWGWSIVFLVLLINAVFFPLQRKAGKSTAKMREFQPRIKAIQERYKDDKQRQSQAMMDLYKKEKINPMGGCLPMLLQIPIYIALYYVLLYSVELRQAPFIFWLTDLSAPDPYYVLPILYGIAQFVMMRVNPQPGDKMQQRIMMVMPLGALAFAIIMPAGLVVYWVSNAILRSLQQWHINSTLHHPKNHKAARGNSLTGKARALMDGRKKR